MEEKCGIGIGIKSERVIVADVIQERPSRERGRMEGGVADRFESRFVQ